MVFGIVVIMNNDELIFHMIRHFMLSVSVVMLASRDTFSLLTEHLQCH